jgi:hypothetical protein
MPNQPISAEDLAVTLAVREDLGLQHEPAVIGEFLDRVGASIDARVDERLAASKAVAVKSGDDGGTGLAICSLIFGIPITAISANSEGGLAALVISWAGIAAINIAHARRRS